jgi:hypothetical protein
MIETVRIATLAHNALHDRSHLARIAVGVGWVNMPMVPLVEAPA